VIEAGPVDTVSAPAGIAVAQLNPPLRWSGLRNEAERALHCRALPLHAARLPLAIHSDVERNWVVQDRRPGRACRQGYRRERGCRQNSLHRRPNDTTAAMCRNRNPRSDRKRKAATLTRRRRSSNPS